MIEEYVIKLAELQTELKKEEQKADEASLLIGAEIEALKADMAKLQEHRTAVRLPSVKSIEKIKTTIESLYAQVVDEWTGEKKTIVFDAGTLKFRTSQSLNILDEGLLLHDIIEHTSAWDAGKTYIKGFNLTAVKKYMTVHPQPAEVAELVSKTTVKLGE